MCLQTGLSVPREVICYTLRGLAEGLYILYFIHNKKDILEN